MPEQGSGEGERTVKPARPMMGATSSRKLGSSPKKQGFTASVSKAKVIPKKQIPKKDKPFVPPDPSLLREIAHATISNWLQVESPSSVGRSIRQVPPMEPQGEFEIALEGRIIGGLREKIRSLEGGPFVKKTALRRQLESLAQQLLVSFAALEHFRPPKEQVLRKAAAEATRRDRAAERIPNFKKLCLQYCAIFMQYNDGNQVEEYLYLALQREMERLKSGPLRSRRDIDSRIEAAINLAYHQIEATLCAIADLGQLYGSVEDETFTVRYVMSTFEKRQEVFLTAQMVCGRRDQSVILGISSSKQFHTTHSRGKDAPAYCNCPASLRQ